MSSVKSQLLDSFKASKEYRHAFVEEKIQTQLAMQIRAIREQRKMSRPEFANRMDKAASWVFRLEDPNQPPPTVPTLLKVAEAFDVDLEIRFGKFSDLLNRIDRMNPKIFEVPSFEEELTNGAFDRKTPSGEELRALLDELISEKPVPICRLPQPTDVGAMKRLPRSITVQPEEYSKIKFMRKYRSFGRPKRRAA